MPELPEVEVVRAGLARFVGGRRIVTARVLDPRTLRRGPLSAEAFTEALVDRLCGTPRRRGKYLWIPLDGTDALLAHLGMSGQFRIDDHRITDRGAQPHRHARVVLGLDDGHQLAFIDQRLFGSLTICPGGAELPQPISHIAPDPFDPDYRLNDVAAHMRARHTTVKRSLLDQSMVSGIGNIYADEALWRARIHGDHPTELMSTRRARAVLRSAGEVMAEALHAGGTSFDSLYVHVNGDSGYFSRALSVYGREGEPCRRCGRSIVRESFMNRSSYFCPRCQRLPRTSGHGAAAPRVVTRTHSARKIG